jgi:hypothetical protein
MEAADSQNHEAVVGVCSGWQCKRPDCGRCLRRGGRQFNVVVGGKGKVEIRKEGLGLRKEGLDLPEPRLLRLNQSKSTPEVPTWRSHSSFSNTINNISINQKRCVLFYVLSTLSAGDGLTRAFLYFALLRPLSTVSKQYMPALRLGVVKRRESVFEQRNRADQFYSQSSFYSPANCKLLQQTGSGFYPSEIEGWRTRQTVPQCSRVPFGRGT